MVLNQSVCEGRLGHHAHPNAFAVSLGIGGSPEFVGGWRSLTLDIRWVLAAEPSSGTVPCCHCQSFGPGMGVFCHHGSRRSLE